MTLRAFERAIQKYTPKLRIRESAYGDIAGVFHNDSYLFRLNKGDLSLLSHTYRTIVSYQPRMQGGKIYEEPVYKEFPHRGYMTALNLLVNYRYLTSRQAQKIMWGYK